MKRKITSRPHQQEGYIGMCVYGICTTHSELACYTMGRIISTIKVTTVKGWKCALAETVTGTAMDSTKGVSGICYAEMA